MATSKYYIALPTEGGLDSLTVHRTEAEAEAERQFIASSWAEDDVNSGEDVTEEQATATYLAEIQVVEIVLEIPSDSRKIRLAQLELDD